MQERDLYVPVSEWLQRRLAREAQVVCAVTAGRPLNIWLEEWQVTEYFPGAPAFEIDVDVAAVSIDPGSRSACLYIVEVKIEPLGLRALSQLLGYCKVAQPTEAWLLSPQGWSEALERLIRYYGRADVLEFAPGRWVVVGKWDVATNTVRPGDILHP